MKKYAFLLLIVCGLVGCSAKKNNKNNSSNSSQNTKVTQNKTNNNQMAVNTAKIGAKQTSKYGWYLVDGNGRSVYLFIADKGKEGSTCYDQCAAMWPPVLTSGNPQAIADVVKSNMLGTIKRHDGSMQVTYNGWPLYYYVKDQGKGQFKGQDLMSYGAEWYLVKPSGKKMGDVE